MPWDSWEEAAGGGGRKQALRHILLTCLEATSVAGAQCRGGAGQCWGAGGGGSLSRPKVTKKEGLGAGGGNSSKGLEDVICNKQIMNLAESFLHPDRA